MMITTHKAIPACHVLIFLLVWAGTSLFGKTHELYSPDKKIKVIIQVDREITYSVFCDGKEILSPSPISLTIEGAGVQGAGEYKAEVYADGVNASKYASDYTKSSLVIKAGDRLKVKLAPGGGWAARLFNKTK